MDYTKVLVMEFKTATGEVVKVTINKPAQNPSGTTIKETGDALAASTVICLNDEKAGTQTPATVFANAYYMIMTKETVEW